MEGVEVQGGLLLHPMNMRDLSKEHLLQVCSATTQRSAGSYLAS